jgi:hypothetical protein
MPIETILLTIRSGSFVSKIGVATPRRHSTNGFSYPPVALISEQPRQRPITITDIRLFALLAVLFALLAVSLSLFGFSFCSRFIPCIPLLSRISGLPVWEQRQSFPKFAENARFTTNRRHLLCVRRLIKSGSPQKRSRKRFTDPKDFPESFTQARLAKALSVSITLNRHAPFGAAKSRGKVKWLPHRPRITWVGSHRLTCDSDFQRKWFA